MMLLKEVVEVEDEGLKALLGKTVEIWGVVYIYAGKLIGVNSTCVKLEDPYVVYATGAHTDPKYKDAQHMGKKYHYVMLSNVESFGETTKL